MSERIIKKFDAEAQAFSVDDTGDGMRLDAFLAGSEAGLSRSAAAALIDRGGVLVNGGEAKKRLILKAGDTVEVFLPDPVPPAAQPEDIPLDIVYEDRELLVVNKPKNMVVHPAPGNPGGTLVNALLFYCGDGLSGINGVSRPGIVHRLDKDTSGLLIVAKTDAAHRGLAAQIAEHSFLRQYAAVVFGVPQPQEGVIDRPIGRSKKDRKKMAIIPGGRRAVTEYSVRRGFSLESAAYSELSLTLKTGRTHQIRVHCASLGHPVAGDALYGAPERDKRLFPGLSGQCLHAGRIGFVHPKTGEYLEFLSPLPAYFQEVLTKLEKLCKIEE